MYGKDIVHLVDIMQKHSNKDESNIKKELSDKLNINIKTFNSWMTDSKKINSKIGRPYVAYMRKIFETHIIKNILRSIEDKAFKIAPSEFICFWLVCGSEIVLIKDSARNELLKPITKFRYFNDEIHKMFNDNSLVVESIQKAQIFNISGCKANNCQKIVAPDIYRGYLCGGVCISTLKIPIVMGTPFGPRVIGLFDMVNKLTRNQEGKLLPFSLKTELFEESLYTEEEVSSLKNMIHKEYDNNLRQLILALDYLEPDTASFNISN